MTYGFLGVMLVALIFLAGLQYKWLGSVSEAEKERLEESLSAAAENFVADFNQVFTELGQTFRIQVSNPDEDISGSLNESYLNWLTGSNYANVLDSVFIVRKSGSESPSVLLFSTDPATLEQILPSESVANWIQNDSKKSTADKRVSFRVNPEFSEQTFLSIPIQFLDMIQVNNEEFGQKVSVQLTVDQLDDIILLKLNDAFIKEEIIPEIARIYFSNSFEDQYQLSLIKEEDTPVVYYTSGDTNNIPKPDFTSSLDRYNFNNVVVFKSQSNFSSNVNIPQIPRDLRFSVENSDLFIESQKDSSDRSLEFQSHILSRNITGIGSNTTRSSTWSVQSQDTTIRTSLRGSMINSPWELWLSFKEGSLDAFVNKTRNRNLGISFGILSIMGISVILIVVFSQRSRELADQQMLFVAGVSHELRTPITVIRSAAENLTEGVVQDENRKKQYADLMLKEGRRLSDMVDQIMEFSGIQSGKRVYHYRLIELEEILESIKDECKHLLDDNGMHIEYSISTKKKTIYGDPDAIFLSITNLINNAVKFSGESKKILLKINEVKFKGNNALQIQVQDYGIGIPEKEQSVIFKPFFRGEKPVNDQVKGNGIGLSLVQKVAMAHRGEVTLKSEEGEGSTFTLILPLKGPND
ncbi:MAG: hypothetical protein BalsKO_02160 [Balneolaceae bacterium]